MPLHHADPGSRPGDAIPKKLGRRRWAEDESPGPTPAPKFLPAPSPLRSGRPSHRRPFPHERDSPSELAPSNLLLKVWTLRVLSPANRPRGRNPYPSPGRPMFEPPIAGMCPGILGRAAPSGRICRDASADMHLPGPSDSPCRSLTCPPIAQLSPDGEKNHPYRYGILTIFFAGCFRLCANSAKPAVGPGREKVI